MDSKIATAELHRNATERQISVAECAKFANYKTQQAIRAKNKSVLEQQRKARISFVIAAHIVCFTLTQPCTFDYPDWSFCFVVVNPSCGALLKCSAVGHPLAISK